tara:strand:+ start:251 stop:1978 length:1728 start_codon:yes stop_codon:yes gene_type:complete
MSNFANKLRERWLVGNQRRIDSALKMAWSELNAARAEEKLKRDYLFGIVQAERKSKDKQASSRVSVSGRGKPQETWYKNKKLLSDQIRTSADKERAAIQGWDKARQKKIGEFRKSANDQLKIRNQATIAKVASTAGAKENRTKSAAKIARTLRGPNGGYLGKTLAANVKSELENVSPSLRTAKAHVLAEAIHRDIAEEFRVTGKLSEEEANKKALNVVNILVPQLKGKIELAKEDKSSPARITRDSYGPGKREASIKEYIRIQSRVQVGAEGGSLERPRKLKTYTFNEWKAAGEPNKDSVLMVKDASGNFTKVIDRGTVLDEEEAKAYADTVYDLEILRAEGRPGRKEASGYSGARGRRGKDGKIITPEFYKVPPVRAEAAFSRAYELMNMGAKPPKKGFVKRLLTLDFKPEPATTQEMIARGDELTIAQKEFAKDQLIMKMRNLPAYAQESIKVWPEASRIGDGHKGVITDREFPDYDKQAMDYSKVLVKNFQNKKEDIDVIMQKLATNKFAESEEKNQQLKKQASTYFWAQTLVDQRDFGNEQLIQSIKNSTPEGSVKMMGQGLTPYYTPIED